MISKVLKQVIKKIETGYEDPYYKRLMKEWFRVQNELGFTRKDLDPNKFYGSVINSIKEHSDKTMSVETIAEKILEYIAEADMQSMILPTDMIIMLDLILYIAVSD